MQLGFCLWTSLNVSSRHSDFPREILYFNRGIPFRTFFGRGGTLFMEKICPGIPWVRKNYRVRLVLRNSARSTFPYRLLGLSGVDGAKPPYDPNQNNFASCPASLPFTASQDEICRVARAQCVWDPYPAHRGCVIRTANLDHVCANFSRTPLLLASGCLPLYRPSYRCSKSSNEGWLLEYATRSKRHAG